ncbi:MAG: glycosyltransferase family 1 protein [bacterium]|nr:MAG: glycosyltransferase family 1 protein [bacterium]
MVKIAFVPKIVTEGDSVRGIGVHTNELVKALVRYGGVEISNETKDADIVHYTKFNPYFISLPFFKPSKKLVLTIHDLIYLVYPDHYPAGVRGKIKFFVNKLLIKLYVDRIVTISETSKKDIVRFLGVDPNIVDVVYLAPKEIFKKKTTANIFNLPKRFALYIGDINFNKNIPNLVKACEIAKIPLVIAGKQASEIESMDLNHPELEHLKGVNFKNVTRLGYVSDEDINKLYNLASVYVQPSLYEGFGLPALESVTVGTPLVATKTQALVEILGQEIRYVDPTSPRALAKALLNPNKKIKLPREYSWEKTAKEMIKVYEKI